MLSVMHRRAPMSKRISLTRDQIIAMCEETSRKIAAGEIKFPPLSADQRKRALALIAKHRAEAGDEPGSSAGSDRQP